MKLFGGKKGGKHLPPSVTPDYEEIPEVEVPVAKADPAPVIPVIGTEGEEIPVISVFEPIVPYSEPEIDKEDADPEVPVIDVFAPAAAEGDEISIPEKDMISSIAEAMGVSPEELYGETPVVDAPKAVTEDSLEIPVSKRAAKRAKKAENASVSGKLLTCMIVILAILVTCGAGVMVSRLWVSQKSMGIYSPDFVEPMPSDDNMNDVTQDSSADGQDAQFINTDRKNGCYTFMVAGRDVQSGCTDVIIVGRLDTINGTIYMVSIPRDTMINKGVLKVNSVYQGDKAVGGNGIDALLREVRNIVGFDIDSWAVVDTSALAKLIDAIGGVYFDVPMDMVYKDVHQNLDINIKKGYQLLSGEDAVKVLRFRKGYANGDLGRIETQHNLILAMAKQVLDVKNIPNLSDAVKIYQECVHSNLSAGNLLFYAKEFLKLDPENIQFVDMPQCQGGLVNGQSFIFINPTKWLTVINNYLNPHKEDITAMNLSIKTSYDGGQTFAYTAGASNK